MQCYSELIPPSGITQAIVLPFLSSASNNLVIARTSLLQIFAHKQVHPSHDTKLTLVAQYNLPGTVIAFGKVKTQNTKSGGESLLVAFRDAKLSLIEWDPTQYGISTISIHYYENYDLQTAPWMSDLQDCVSHLTVDPGSRCAAFNFGISNLAIIPFHQERDDLAMDDFDDLDDEIGDKKLKDSINGESQGHTTPYFPSFVLPMTMLDPSLIHPVNMAFLHEYRDPTIGILYSSVARSENMIHERKDVSSYAVYALDLEQKASTTLQSVQYLPNDLFAVEALPLPVGGTLLIGGNELIHVDQSGKASAIGVNEFARESSAFPMIDHAEYQMRLEGCKIEQLGNAEGDMLLVLNTGDMAILNFRLDGRSVSGMSLRRVEEDNLKEVFHSKSSCIAQLGLGQIFVGSEDSTSVLLGPVKKPFQLRRQSSKAQTQDQVYTNGDENEEDVVLNGNELDDDDEDDLYGDATSRGFSRSRIDSHMPAGSLQVLDKLQCIAPLNDVTLGRSLKRKREDDDYDPESVGLIPDKLELAVAYGKGESGGVALFSRQLSPNVNKLIRRGNTTGIWAFNVEGDATSPEQELLHDHVILSEEAEDFSGQSSLWTINEGELQVKAGTEFDGAAGATIEVGRLTATNHTVQVTPTEVRVYDSDFGLSQIFPIVDEEEGQMSRAVRASCVEPYLVLLKDDNTIIVLKADRSGELDEVEIPSSVREMSIISASLYADTTNFFQSARFNSTKASTSKPDVLLSLLTIDGEFQLLPLSNLKIEVVHIDNLDFLPIHLAQDSQIPKHWKSKDELADALITDLGDSIEQKPFLIVRNTTGDVVLYEVFAVPEVIGTYKLRKVATRLAEYSQDDDDKSMLLSMQVLRDFSGYSSVFIPGAVPRIILKHASTAPRIYDFGYSNVKCLCGLKDEVYGHDLVFVDAEGDLCIGAFPSKATFGESDWVVEKVNLGHNVVGISYFEPAQLYVLGVDYVTDFQLPQDDEWHSDWQDENTQLLPTTLQSSLKLMSSTTHSIISQFHFDPSERILCMKTMNLEISEESHERKTLIAVGTAVTKGENIVTRGNIYIFDVVDVVPQPEVPESDLKLKLLSKEDVRGAVTALCEVGSQGFLLAAQGQKCMVRGLKEDMSILPVAFLDMRYYVSVAKELKGTGLCVLGDAFSGMWLVGYSEEPYKMQLLGRDLDNPSTITAEFLPVDKELFIFTSDGDGRLRLLQYDPENPKAERGTKLLERTTFNSGAFPTTMTLLPRTPVSSELPTDKPLQAFSDSDNDTMSVDGYPSPNTEYATNQVLITTQEGSIALITPLSDSAYRRLSNLQNILITNLEHPCSLNPRAYRAVETDGLGGRGMIDGNLIRRWLMQSSQHKASTADKVGGTIWEVRGDLESIGGGGLGFL